MNNQPFAFISYSRKDYDVASDLRKRLEKYVYPKEWVKEENRPADPEYVRKIYMDLTDLSVKEPDFNDELKEKVAKSKYLIVICSAHSASSNAVKSEIDYFLKTHENNSDLIVCVYIDNVFSGMHPVADDIVAKRNCPIYVTGRGEAGHVGRKYCFYHLLEFLLKVDFDKLYNRYEEYKKKKQKRRNVILTTFLSILFFALGLALFQTCRRAQIEHARVEFEMKVFPYSVVVGYLDNFIKPTMEAIKDSCNTPPHFIIPMPSKYAELEENVLKESYEEYLRGRYPGYHTSTESLTIPGRNRASSVERLYLKSDSLPLYIDYARTVLSFKKVIDWKFDSGENPVAVPFTKDQLTSEYSSVFIHQALSDLKNDSIYLHFVSGVDQMQTLLDSLGI